MVPAKKTVILALSGSTIRAVLHALKIVWTVMGQTSKIARNVWSCHFGQRIGRTAWLSANQGIFRHRILFTARNATLPVLHVTDQTHQIASVAPRGILTINYQANVKLQWANLWWMAR